MRRDLVFSGLCFEFNASFAELNSSSPICLDTHVATEQRVGKKNVIVMYTCKDNLIPLLYSGKRKKKEKRNSSSKPLKV